MFATLAVLVAVSGVKSLPALAKNRPLNEVELAAAAFLQEDDFASGILLNEQAKAQWNYETNLTDHNDQVLMNVNLKVKLALRSS